MSPSEPHDRLSSLVRQALREQPDAQAPADLADRVLREIERRHAQVWWQRSLAFWPRTAQLLFVVASIACAVLLWLLFSVFGTACFAVGTALTIHKTQGGGIPIAFAPK